MLLRGHASHVEVIEVCRGKGESPGDLIDKPLECLSSVSQSERHADVLEESKRCLNCSLWYVQWLDRDLVVGLH